MKLMNKFGLALLALFATSIAPAATVGPPTQKAPTVVLSKDNLILLNSEINGESAAEVISKARELCPSGALASAKRLVAPKRLKLFLYTPGGSIQAGLEITEALNGLGCPVDTVTLFAASMGWQLVESLGDRLVLKNGVMMSHHAYGQSEGEFGGSVKSQMDNRQQLWLDRVKELDDQTVKRTNGKQTYESYTKEYDHEMWLTGTKSVNEGYSDKIVTVSCDESLAGTTTHHINFLGIDISYDLDNCPINTSPMNVRVDSPITGKMISKEVVALVKQQFLSMYAAKYKQAIPLYW